MIFPRPSVIGETQSPDIPGRGQLDINLLPISHQRHWGFIKVHLEYNGVGQFVFGIFLSFSSSALSSAWVTAINVSAAAIMIHIRGMP